MAKAFKGVWSAWRECQKAKKELEKQMTFNPIGKPGYILDAEKGWVNPQHLTAQQARIALAEGKIVEGADEFSYRWPAGEKIECAYKGDWSFDKDDTCWLGPDPACEPYTIVEPEPEKPKPRRLYTMEEARGCRELTIVYPDGYVGLETVTELTEEHPSDKGEIKLGGSYVSFYGGTFAEIQIALDHPDTWAVYEGHWTREEIENA